MILILVLRRQTRAALLMKEIFVRHYIPAIILLARMFRLKAQQKELK